MIRHYQGFLFSFPSVHHFRQITARKTGEIGGLYFDPILVHRIEFYSLIHCILRKRIDKGTSYS
jgi:hypothetical protein